MCKLGTWTTFDCPTDKVDEAFNWLYDRFEIIGGNVRKVWNDHDFGPYPSFEIDIPSDLEEVDDDPYLMEGEELDEETKNQIEEKDKWIEEANKIEADYSQQFGDYL